MLLYELGSQVGVYETSDLERINVFNSMPWKCDPTNGIRLLVSVGIFDSWCYHSNYADMVLNVYSKIAYPKLNFIIISTLNTVIKKSSSSLPIAWQFFLHWNT